MYIPPTDPRDRPATKQPTWRNVLAAHALLAAVPLALWLHSNPLSGAAFLAAIAGLAIGARRALRLARCGRRCGGYAFELGRSLRVTITYREPGSEPTDERGADARRASNCC